MDEMILEIKDQSLSSIIVNFFICKNCGIVDHEMERVRYDFKCPNCNKETKGARFYFPLGIPSLVDLMQKFYHIESSNVSNSNLHVNVKNNHQLSVVIFFCSLGELLLEHFLQQYLTKLSIPYKLQDKLLWDVSIKKRLELYSTLTNQSFEKDIRKLTKSSKFNYLSTYKFYIDVRDKRNQFLHAGRVWSVPKSMPKKCLINTYTLLHIFVDLHNIYLVKNK